MSMRVTLRGVSDADQNIFAVPRVPDGVVATVVGRGMSFAARLVSAWEDGASGSHLAAPRIFGGTRSYPMRAWWLRIIMPVEGTRPKRA